MYTPAPFTVEETLILAAPSLCMLSDRPPSLEEYLTL